MYLGYTVLEYDDAELVEFYEGRLIPQDIKANQYIILKDKMGNVIDKGRWDDKTKFTKLSYQKFKDFKPLSLKQEFLFDMLSNPNIPIRIIAGCAGSGKSRITIKFGLNYLNKGTYAQIFVVRHNVSVGEKNGYLPGDKNSKLRGWLGFLEDNLCEVEYTVEEMIDRKMIDLDGVEFMKGRDLKNQYILIDEAEDLTCEQFKMIGERVSNGSVINFVGDVNQVTQSKYSKNSGLRRAIENLAGNPKVGVIVFDDTVKDNVRSEVSKIFTSTY